MHPGLPRIAIRQIDIPDLLQQVEPRPKCLFEAGTSLRNLLELPRVAIVGSRRATSYGHEVTTRLASELAARGIVIISGLALGIDAVAHRAALEAGGLTLAVLPSQIERIAPATHRGLARQIVEQGGTLMSEHPADAVPNKYNFVSRNRLMAALADVVIITEAAENSGSLHTAGFAKDMQCTVMAVPGDITSPTSRGTNQLIKTGATPITSYRDVLHVLELNDTVAPTIITGSTPQEQQIIDLMLAGTKNGEDLLERSGLNVSEYSQALTMLEISGKIRPLGANQWAVVH